MAKRKKKSRLVSMENPKPRKRRRSESPVDIDDEKYPWGLRLHFSEEQIKKIPGLMAGKVGGEVKIVAKADMTEKRINEEQTSKGGDKKERSVVLQITDISIKPNNDNDFNASFDELTA